MRHSWFVIVVLSASGCMTAPPPHEDGGRLSGKLSVFWVSEDKFVYYPDPDDPLVYRLPPDLAGKLDIRSIRPGLMYTDGGSIPRIFRSVDGLSPWGYAPAYIVHDWLFLAHHCVEENMLSTLRPEDRADADIVGRIEFPASADILATVVSASIEQNLVEDHPAIPGAVYAAVRSPFARKLWDSRGAEKCPAVGGTSLGEVAAAVAPRSRAGIKAARQGLPPAIRVDEMTIAP